jgi:hypothetical protein
VRKLLFLTILTLGLNADYYMAQFQPYRTVSVKAEISGVVERVALNRELSYIGKSAEVLKIDTVFEDIQIEALRKRISATEEALQLRRENLKSKKRVRSISQYEINNETLAVVETKSNLYALRMDFDSKRASREKKVFYLENSYLGQFYVEEGEFVPTGTPLFDYYDFSKGKLDIFVGAEEIEGIVEKKILINGEVRDDFRVEKVSSVKDSKRISTYRVRLVRDIEHPIHAKFGEIYRVEFSR